MKLFQKNEVTFAVLLIVIYVFAASAAQRISETIGIEFLAETVCMIAMTAVLLLFIRKNGLSNYLGLKKPEVSSGRMLFYIPLALTASVAAFFGMGTEYSPLVSVLRFIMMCCVGFLEEVIFRGFLFRGIAKENLTRAVIISSLTFGIGHFVNILNGSDLFENSVQVVYAAAVAFLLVLIFLRTSSILPCIAFHAFNNCLTAFTTGDILTGRLGERNSALLVVGIKILIAGAYLLYVSRLPKRDLPTD